MAKYRQVYCEFWRDTKVSEEMTPEDRYFMLYLLTNSHANQIGVYEISKKVMAFELGYTQESVNAVIDRFVNHHKLIKYNPETREIAVRNWGRYNFVRGGKPVLDLMSSEMRKVKDLSLLQWVFQNYVSSAVGLGELNMPICELFDSFFEKTAQPIVDATTDEPCHEPSDDTSYESYNEAGAISISINNKNNNIKHIVHSDSSEPETEPFSKADQANALFDELWAIYPHKKGKGQVKNAHKLLLLKHGKDKLVRAIQRYMAYVDAQRKGGFMLQYQNGSTFFHTGYVDYLADEYVPVAVTSVSNKGGGKPAGAGNKFHNFEHHASDLSGKELEAKLRNRGGGLGGNCCR